MDILKKAIHELPSYDAPQEAWSNIETTLNQEQNIDVLNRAIAEYKIEKQALVSWEEIEFKIRQQEHDQILKKAIGELPTHQPKGDHFRRIIASVSGGTAQYLYWLSGIAASAVILITSHLLFYKNTEDHVALNFSEEIMENQELFTSTEMQKNEEDQVLNFIQENCTIVAYKCNTPEFKNLLGLYQDLSVSQMELTAEISQNQNHVQLLEYLLRVEREKAEIGNELIQLIIEV